MILIWGLPADEPLAMVERALLRRGCEVRFLDQRLTVTGEGDLSVGAGVGADVGDGVAGALTHGGSRVDLAACTAAYLRPYDGTELAAVRRAGAGSPEWGRALAMDDLLTGWSELTGALVVNRPSAMLSNCSKPFQAAELRRAGFTVPETLITTDPDAVRAFRAEHGRVVYKSVSGVRSIVSELTDAHLSRLDRVTWCPTQFQRRIPGVDYRVHVVGREVFAHVVDSDADDYRYAGVSGSPAVIRAGAVPDEIAARCVTATRDAGLVFSGVDLRRTPEDEWYCFEMNPSPGFSYYQGATGQPIDEAVADALIAGAD